jgi:fermentation-respiration switch protein FrsA (DUF1100 family)
MRRALALLLGLLAAAPARAEAPAASPATRDETVMLALDDGREVPATIRVPLGQAGPLPALMLFGGFQNAATVLERVRTDRPLVWATFNYPFEPPRKFRFPGSLKHAPEARAAIHGSFDGVVKLHQALRRRPDVDPARISVVGASAGAPFATIGAARSPIPGVILVQGFGDITPVFQNLLARKYRKRWGEWVRWPALWLAKWMTWYLEIPDIAAHARQLRAGQKVLMFTATDDDFIPKASTERLWDALQASAAQRERVDLEGLHLGVGDDRERIADILRRAMAWMERNGLL